jgi:glycerol uptake facilitator-like aquaporin
MGRRLAAELLGTFWLVFGGGGSAILATQFLDPQNRNVNYGIGLFGVALAFGLTVLTMAYAKVALDPPAWPGSPGEIEGSALAEFREIRLA